MTITSFSFLVLITIGVIVYYIVPKKMQWIELLVVSIIFYYHAATPYTIAYLLFSTIVVYVSTYFVDQCRKQNNKMQKIPLMITVFAITVNVLIWFLIKGKGLWAPVAGKFISLVYSSKIEAYINFNFVAALGMGYYTLQLIGYIIDCYWGNVVPQKNPLKLFLFTAFFPQLMTGPISRYAQLSELYEGHKFRYKNIAFGTQRILWGFMKKLVLAERVGILVSAIIESPQNYSGFYAWLVILLYPIQMYADFSGCMDIVIGVSELFDIHLVENFNNPFFSRTAQEFWQRWHITLGAWARDYVLFPLLKSSPMIKLRRLTKRFGRRASKFIVNAVGMFILWMVMGIWHGEWKYIIGVSLWYWIILMLGEFMNPALRKLTSVLSMKTESFGWHFFQSCRTYVIYAIGAVIFNLGIVEACKFLKEVWKTIFVKDYANPGIFFNGSLTNLGITYGDINIFFISLFLLSIVAILREKYGYARNWIAEQSFGFRWIIWISLFLFVLIWGKYGPEYNASLFIYQGF